MIRLTDTDFVQFGQYADGKVKKRELTLQEHLEISKALARFYGRNIGKKYFDKHIEVVV